MNLLSEVNLLRFVSFLCFIGFSKGEGLNDVYVKECDGSSTRLSHGDDTSAARYEIYEKKYGNCTRVKSNLEIVYLSLPDETYDFSFLDNIREVDGYVLIVGNIVNRIRLNSLRVIRGLALFGHEKERFSLYVGQNSLANNTTVGLRELQMPALVEILQGSIFFESNSRLCFVDEKINWNYTLSNNRVGRVVHSPVVPGYEKVGCKDVAVCNETCPAAADGKKYCWGSGGDMCQSINRCGDETCKRCSKDGVCCDALCVAGCNGKHAKNCLSCRDFTRKRSKDSECVEDCSAQVSVKTIDGNEMQTPVDKYAHRSECVEECEAGFVSQDNICSQNCDSRSMVKENDTKLCVPCEGKCPQTCKGTGAEGWLHKHQLPFYSGCLKVEGNLRIDKQSFYGHWTTEKISVDDLDRLSSITEITGMLSIEDRVPEFTSLKFLRNLRVISGAGSPKYALKIVNTALKSLDLNSLHWMEKGVYINNNTDLCYAERINWTTLTEGVVKVQGRNKNTSLCDNESLVCSSSCLSSNGCMGPGNASCISCPHFQAMDLSCLPNCPTENGFFVKDGIRGNIQCRPCHKECKRNCSGDGPDHCFECRSAKHLGICINKCPSQMYTDADGVCQSCNSLCNECTGNSTVYGESGCTRCNSNTILYENETTWRCILSEDECNATIYFRYTLPASEMRGCRKCHPECIGCSEEGPTKCTKCRHKRLNHTDGDPICVARCFNGFYDDGQGECRPCHSQCSGCNGPEADECIACRNVRIYQNSEENVGNHTGDKSYCAEECPTDSSRVKKGNQSESTCAVRADSSFMTPSTAIPVFVALFLVIFIGLVIFFVFWRKQKLRRLRENILAIDAIPMINSSKARPDMASIRLVKESELRRGNVIGSGAFGTVYKGMWIPEKENVKIPVAIKVLQESSNTNLNVELLDESRIMASVRNPYCVRILAVCMTAQMMLITQLMPLGCLLDYVRKERSNIGSRALLLWSVQIAKGMKYLESLGIVHRDLAARNVLVHNPNQVKITDFGLAKLLDYEEEEIHSEGGKMPIKWLALECIQHRIYTHKSDVWSYGVTLWEMFSYGSRPYENLQARQIPLALEKGERLPQPNIATIDVYMILIKCWMLDVESRPTFSDLATEFTRMAGDPGRFLVIPGDKLMRLPSQEPDTRDLIRMMSLPLDEPDLMIMSGEEYLRPKDLELGGSDGSYPPSSSPLGPLTSIPEDVTYENSELMEGRRAQTKDEIEGHTSGKFSHQYSREGSQRYITDPCRIDAGRGGSRETGKPNEDVPSLLRVDEDGYLPPQSASTQQNYLDLIYQGTSDNPEITQNNQQYLDMNTASVGVSRDNLEYFDNEAVCLTGDISNTNKTNTDLDQVTRNNNDSEYCNVTSTPENLPFHYKRLPETDI